MIHKYHIFPTYTSTKRSKVNYKGMTNEAYQNTYSSIDRKYIYGFFPLRRIKKTNIVQLQYISMTCGLFTIPSFCYASLTRQFSFLFFYIFFKLLSCIGRRPSNCMIVSVLINKRSLSVLIASRRLKKIVIFS